MVPDLVRDHIRLREVTRRAEPRAHGLVELQVDVDLAIARAIKRPHRRLAGAAGGRRGTAKQHQPRLLVGPALLPRTAHFHTSSVSASTVDTKWPSCRRPAGAGAGPCCTTAPRRMPPPLSTPSSVSGLMPRIQPPDQSDPRSCRCRCCDHRRGGTRRRPARALAAPVFDVVALPVAFPLHVSSLRSSLAAMVHHAAAAVTSARSMPAARAGWVAQRVATQALGSVTPRCPWYLPPRSL